MQDESPQTPAETAALAAFRADFPAFEEQIYLNLSARGLISRTTRRAVDGALEAQMFGRVDKSAWKAAGLASRAAFARLCHADPEEIAVTCNVSDGLNAILTALPWQPSDNLVCCTAFEHPNGTYSLWNLRRHGVELRDVPLEGCVPDSGSMIAAMDERTRLVMVSAVGFATGLRPDLARLGAACAERGIFFLVDAAQGIGVTEFDMTSLAVDGLAASTNKGLLGLYGQGFLYCRRSWADRLVPTGLSRFGVDVGGAHESEMGPENYTLLPGARRFELGNPNWPGLVASAAAQEALLALKPALIQRQAFAVARHLDEGLAEAGFDVVRPEAPGQASHVTVITSRDAAAADRLARLGKALQTAGVTHSIRRGSLRFAAHAYNTIEDAEAVIRLAWRSA